MSFPSSIRQYMVCHATELGERILASYPPLYGPEDAPSPALSQMLRTPYPAQTLAILGVPSAGKSHVAHMWWPNVEREKH